MKPDAPLRSFSPDSTFLLMNDPCLVELVEQMAVDRRILRIMRTAEPFLPSPSSRRA